MGRRSAEFGNFKHPEEGKDPWDQLPHESSLDYSRFLVFRDLGPDRRIRKAQRACGFDMSPNDRPRLFNLLSQNFSWYARAHAWDTEQQTELHSRLAQAVAKRRQVNLDVFDRAAAMAPKALAACEDSLDQKTSTAAMKAASYIFNLIGYEPPESNEETKGAQFTAEQKARMLDVLTPTERAMLQALNEKMVSAINGGAGGV